MKYHVKCCCKECAAKYRAKKNYWRNGDKYGISHDDFLHLMEIYLSERSIRDTNLWKQVFAYFWATLIVMILPWIEPLGLRIPTGFPRIIFPIVGIVMACAFLFITKAYVARLECVNRVYQSMIVQLPKELQRPRVTELGPDIKYHLYDRKMASFVSGFMFLLLMLVGVSLILYYAIG